MGRYEEFISMDGKAKTGIVANPELWSEDMKQYVPDIGKVENKYARRVVGDFARILKYKDAGIPDDQIKFLMSPASGGLLKGNTVHELLESGKPRHNASEKEKRAWKELMAKVPEGTDINTLSSSVSNANETYKNDEAWKGIEKKPQPGFVEGLAGNLWEVAKFAAPYVATGLGMQWLSATFPAVAAAPSAAAAETVIATGSTLGTSTFAPTLSSTIAEATAATAAPAYAIPGATTVAGTATTVGGTSLLSSGTAETVAGTTAGTETMAAATPFLETKGGELLVKGGLALADSFFSNPAEVPEMSPEEKEMSKLMLDDVRKASAEDKAITPLILQQMGIVENEDGTYRQMTEDERVSGMTELQRDQYDITGLELQRQKTALEGKLPLTEGTKQRYEEDRKAFEANMAQKLGPGWETSTPGIQSQKAFESKWDLTKDEERYQQLQRGTGAIQAQYGLMEGIPAAKAGQYAAFPQRRTGLLTQYGTAAAPFAKQRGLEYQGDVAAEKRRTGLLTDIGKGIGDTLYPRKAGTVERRY